LSLHPWPGSDGTTTWKASAGSPAVRAGVGERAENPQELGHRTRPPVRDDQRERIRLRRTDVQEVDPQPVDGAWYCGNAFSRAVLKKSSS
jgi:hypothetical protein